MATNYKESLEYIEPVKKCELTTHHFGVITPDGKFHYTCHKDN